MQYSGFRHRRQRKPSLWQSQQGFTFMVFLCLLVIVVLVFKLVLTLMSPKLLQGVQMYMVSGSAQLQIWGTDSYFELKSDTVVMQGDKLLTSAGGRVIIEFFDGTLLRMDEGTELVFNVVDGDARLIDVSLEKGQVWFNRIYKGSEDVNIKLHTKNLDVLAKQAGVFSVSANFDEQAVRVYNAFSSGGLEVEIFDENRVNVVEKEGIGIAQQIVFSNDVLASYWQFKSPTVLEGIDSEYRESDWFVWNLSEDESPTVFEVISGVEDVGLLPAPVEGREVLEDDAEIVEAVAVPVVEDEALEVRGEEIVASGVSVPAVISVSGGSVMNENGFYVVKNNPAVIRGSINGARGVVVNGYALTKFVPGDTVFVYYANADFNLMSVGENVFEIYGVDASGNKGEAIQVKVIYAPEVESVQEEAEVTPEEGSGESDVEEQL